MFSRYIYEIWQYCMMCGVLCVMVNLCTSLISDLQMWAVPASWALCTCTFQDHNKQPGVVTRQSQGLNTKPEFSSDGRDRHGNRVKAFEASQTHEQGCLAASVSSDRHLEVHRNTKLLLGFSKIQQRTAAGRVASPPALGGPQELPCASPSPRPGRFRSGRPDFPHRGDPLLWDLGPLAGI